MSMLLPVYWWVMLIRDPSAHRRTLRAAWWSPVRANRSCRMWAGRMQCQMLKPPSISKSMELHLASPAQVIMTRYMISRCLTSAPSAHNLQNWADRPFFNDSVLSWYWGHASLGPYSVVWFDALDSEGTEYFSTYVARDGQVLAINCENGTAIVRPWGGEDTYPPPAGSETPNGFIITFADVEGQEFTINVTTFATPVPNPLYNRFIGTAEGSFHGENETFVGVASYEQFKAV
jgi:hypothetical protein